MDEGTGRTRRLAMKGFKSFMQHLFNPLHLFCRLRDAGVEREKAKKFCCAYERYLYKKVGG
jgi:hypothetical protein